MKSATALKGLSLALGILAIGFSGSALAHGGHYGGGHPGFHGGYQHVNVYGASYNRGYRGGYRGYGYGYNRGGYYRNGVWVAGTAGVVVPSVVAGTVINNSCVRYVCSWRTNVNGVRFKQCGNQRVC